MGAQDKVVPLAHGARMNSAIFNSRLIAYPDIGHLPMEEAPARTAAEARICGRIGRQLSTGACYSLRLARNRLHGHGFTNFHYQCLISRRLDKALTRLFKRLE